MSPRCWFLLGPLTLAVALLQPACRGKTGPEATSKQPERGQWHCPMHPSYVSERPGSCPICGMDLVRLQRPPEEAPATGSAGLAPVTIGPERRQLIALRTVRVRRGPLSGTIRTIGRVAYDETRVHHIHARFEAYIERLYADFTGKYVRKGEPLVSLYSPELLAAEQEYLLALRAQREGNASGGGLDLVQAARQKLLLWNISPADIAVLEQSGQPSPTRKLYAPTSGYIVQKTAVHGMRVRPEDSLFDIVDLSRMWVLADLYEYELPRLRLGQKGRMTLSYWPGRTWEGKVTYIYPSVDAKTRTIKVRLEVDNPHHELKAEMFADVVLFVEPRQVLVVPEDAVIDTGKRHVVFRALGGGRLLPREVTTGDRADGLVEIRAGLEEGDEVASGANFLLDSESRLQAVLSAMEPPADGGTSGAARHGGHP
ncbi:MAG: efflux RND transporter periplasmic adaptor subunit [Myxococcales bacterium]|nr:efflux RND transporter periplasmic adaptor subunit [Myxococcota bacterium]MDW8284189.1 efflux RND transporter periplasmic adaptor subunit [Myxococcales bacterium]